jgi:hypothetical protein
MYLARDVALAIERSVWFYGSLVSAVSRAMKNIKSPLTRLVEHVSSLPMTVGPKWAKAPSFVLSANHVMATVVAAPLLKSTTANAARGEHSGFHQLQYAALSRKYVAECAA